MAKIDLVGKLDDARARVEAETPAEDRGLAKFARLTRKDARVRADQDAALAALAKTLMRRRPVKAERITENTLIRVAIDLLLTHAGELRGSTEDELRESVTSAPPDVRISGLPSSRTSAVSNSATRGVADSSTPTVADTRASTATNAHGGGADKSRAADSVAPFTMPGPPTGRGFSR